MLIDVTWFSLQNYVCQLPNILIFSNKLVCKWSSTQNDQDKQEHPLLKYSLLKKALR